MNNNLKQKILGKLMIATGKEIMDGTCGLDEDEIDALVELLCTRKLTMEQSSNFINVDPTTLRRMIRNEELPQPHKEAGSKKYFFKKDLIDVKDKGRK